MWTDATRRKHARKGLRYSSDMTDAEWAVLEPHFPAPSRVGRPRKWTLREIVDALAGLRERGLHGVEYVVSDNHAGLKAAIREILPEAAWQRCYVHFLRNALDYVPRKVDDDCLMELRWFYDRRDLDEVRRDIAQWVTKWQGKYPKLVAWVEENVEETLTYYRLPLAHHKHMKSTNMLERLNQELKRRTLVVRIFPNTASCLRLSRALAVEIHEGWLEATRYLNMDHLKEHKKQTLRALAA